jgi:hypothetical protein
MGRRRTHHLRTQLRVKLTHVRAGTQLPSTKVRDIDNISLRSFFLHIENTHCNVMLVYTSQRAIQNIGEMASVQKFGSLKSVSASRCQTIPQVFTVCSTTVPKPLYVWVKGR